VPSWGEILKVLQTEAQLNGGVDLDGARHKYISQLQVLTGRNTVLYTTDYLGKGGPQTSINLGDMQGLMEVFKGLSGGNLDLVLHSPGGQAEATESLVKYMRSKFSHVRVFVPLAAMSAATMWATAADEIVMGKHSQLGPIDPQITLPSGIPIPAGALIEQFEQAAQQLSADPSRIAAWLPTLQQYQPGILNICKSAGDLAEELVAKWLKEYMFSGDADKVNVADEIAAWLSNDKAHLSHGRALTRDQLRDKGMKIVNLEDDDELQDAVLSVHHIAMHSFQSSAVKIIQNHIGSVFIQHGGQQITVPMPVPASVPSLTQGQNGNLVSMTTAGLS